MADEHEKGDEETVRGPDERSPLTSNDPVTGDDLSAVQADDRLLDALGAAKPHAQSTLVEDELNALLLAWRHEVDTEPHGELVDTETALATIAAARPKEPHRHRFLIPLASAAAVLAIAFTGVSLVARDAQPGDALWGLTRVLYSEHAKSVEAAVAVRTDLESARLALREGRVDEAREKLDKVEEFLPSVSTDDGQEKLSTEHKELKEELNTNAPASPTSPTPPSTKHPKPTTQPSTPSSTPSPTTTTTPPSTSSSTQSPPPQDPTSNATETPAPPPAEPPAGTGTGSGTASGSSADQP
ncbi:hypothetical protein Lesp02_26300 [Lentzea sp. NBRC 105346]|uniref:anti-sigma-D factor RsdA n=1 Tax=Lentzea sp. NBRC 105346 TaxID=3032205 RepID=UPI0025558B5E|nr:anti-sigma-D factor RsdA [Lentzea sp. NBRC 105346]GLZ30441.1 hypothetical protein Lesp02_26300 [Lentzea sp. NBRC 105346]